MIFEVLMYLFDHYMDGGIAFTIDEASIVDEMTQKGFPEDEIDRAFNWLEGLSVTQSVLTSQPSLSVPAVRCYLVDEQQHIGVEERGLLLYFEQLGIIDPLTREIVIDRLMALDESEIDKGRLKWVVLLVLFNQPEKKEVLALLQDMVLADAVGQLQ